MPVQLWHHLKTGILSRPKPLHRLSIICLIHLMSTQVKSHMRKMGSSRAQGALASKETPKRCLAGTKVSCPTETAKKRQRQQRWDSDSILMSGVQAGQLPGELQDSSILGASWYFQLDAVLLHHIQVGQEPPWSRCSLLVPQLCS